MSEERNIRPWILDALRKVDVESDASVDELLNALDDGLYGPAYREAAENRGWQVAGKVLAWSAVATIGSALATIVLVLFLLLSLQKQRPAKTPAPRQSQPEPQSSPISRHARFPAFSALPEQAVRRCVPLRLEASGGRSDPTSRQEAAGSPSQFPGFSPLWSFVPIAGIPTGATEFSSRRAQI